ncbi:alpha/beta fold hydrolase, partial [Streptomyces sp. NPDC031705]|uniref:thioesterase II family protein n=1 Tax=Streptomyces sp. NPDC031705 TaxID=3155729 RepID=UPI0033D8CD36
MRLFVFHHAGGSHFLYRDWPGLFPAGWDVRLLDAPGHGRLMGQPPYVDAAALADHFLAALDSELDVPYALFGHSMGGLIAYELALRLSGAGRTPPAWLGMSGRGAPGHGSRRRVPRHLLADEDLRRELAALGGTPAEVLDHPGMWQMFEPVIRADLRLVETWRPDLSAAPRTAVSVFGGVSDPSVPHGHLAAWAGRTEHFIGMHLFEGGHFYFLPDPRD